MPIIAGIGAELWCKSYGETLLNCGVNHMMKYYMAVKINKLDPYNNMNRSSKYNFG